MSWYDGVPAASLYVGPPQDYPAAAASSAAAQSLVTGASGGFSQASLPVGLFPLDKQGRAIVGHAGGKLTGQATATTATFAMGTSSTANSITTGTGTATLVTTPALTVTSLASVGWELDFRSVMRGAGYGGTTVATSLLTTATLSIATLQSIAVPTLVTTIDASITQWLWFSVTFSTASTTNSATLQSLVLYMLA